jgi:hypothetical protein
MLPDLEPAADAEIVAENLRAVQAIYFAFQLEQMRAFQVVERVAELFEQGLLPIGKGAAADALRRYRSAGDRLTAQDRAQLYARVLGAPEGQAAGDESNAEFNALWLRFITSVSMFVRQPTVEGLRPLGSARARRAARALAAHASARAAGTLFAARRLAAETKALLALLDAAEIRQAFGARDLWQVIDQVNCDYLGGASNSHRYRTRAQAGKALLDWLAAHAQALQQPVAAVGEPGFGDAMLIVAAQQWLDASGVPQDAADPALPRVDLPSLAHRLLQALGLDEQASRLPGALEGLAPLGSAMALFCGAPGTGKTLAAHALAVALSRELIRVDLRQLVGKYVGETEKNLDAVLADAERLGALLLLDEADALFGKRSDVQDAHDRYANSDLGGLLQRIAAHRGVVILETTIAPTADDLAPDAEGRRRVQHIVRFPRPQP